MTLEIAYAEFHDPRTVPNGGLTRMYNDQMRITYILFGRTYIVTDS